METTPFEIAIVGAGMSGLTCAEALQAEGHRVTVFEKARGPGGRMSTRRADDLRFDHGAQYFTARDPAFVERVERWRADGVVAVWDGRIVVLEQGAVTPKHDDSVRYVGVPGMNAICRRLGDGIHVAYQTRVDEIRRVGERWWMAADDGADLGAYDVVVVSAPAPQAATLLADVAPDLAAQAAGAEMAPCVAAMVAFECPLELGFDAAFVNDAPLNWVMRNTSKEERPTAEAWVLHGSPEWSSAHLENDPQASAALLLAAFRDVLGGLAEKPVHLVGHRWAYALPTEPLPEACLYDEARRIAVCGDWCGGPRVEGAYLSGRAAADAILAR